MKQFIRYYISIRILWSVLIFSSLCVVEKYIQEATKDTSHIILVRVIFVTIPLLVMLIPTKTKFRLFNKIYVYRMLNITVISTILFTITMNVSYISGLVFIIIISLMNLLLLPALIHLLSMGIKHNNKKIVNKQVSLYTTISGFVVYGLLSILLTERIYILYISIFNIVITLLLLVLLNLIFKLWASKDTRDHFILNQQQINFEGSTLHSKKYYKLKDNFGILILLLIFSSYYIVYSLLDPLTTVYVNNILHKGQEVKLLFFAVFMLGSIITSFYGAMINSKVRVSYMIQNSSLALALFMFIVYRGESVYYLLPIYFLVGALNSLIILGVTTSIHQNTKPEKLNKRLLIHEWIVNVITVLGNSSIWYILKYTKINIQELSLYMVVFLSIILGVTSIIRLFKPRVRDMTYTSYR